NNQNNRNAEEERRRRIEQEKAREREDYIRELDRRVEDAKNPYAKLMQFYGQGGKMPSALKGSQEYNRMRLNAPAGTDENFVAALTLGAMMNPSRLDRYMTSSGFLPGTTTYVDFNQNFFLDNIPSNDARLGDFPQVVLQGRIEAQQAVTQMIDKGNEEPAYDNIWHFIRSSAKAVGIAPEYTSAGLLNDRGYSAGRAGQRLAADMISREPYRGHFQISEYDRMRLMATGNQMRVKDELLLQKAELMKNPPAAGSPEREAAVAELMFKEYVIGTLSNENSEKSVRMQEILQEIMNRNGVTPGTKEYSRFYGDGVAIAAVSIPLSRNIERNRITDREVILSQPDGVDKLRSMYMASIRKTKVFTDLVAAKGNDFLDQLIALDRSASKGLGSFTEIKTGGEAEPFNVERQELYTQGVEAAEARFREIMDDFAKQDNRITAYDAKNLKQNHAQVENYLKELDRSVKLLPGDTNVQAIRREMQNLEKQAAALGKAGKASPDALRNYTGTIDRISAGIDAFFQANGDSPSEDKLPLYLNLRRLSRNLKWNRAGIMEPEKKREREQMLRISSNSFEKPSPGGIDALVQMKKEQFSEDTLGSESGRKELVGRAVIATEKLGELLKKNEPIEGERKTEALSCLKDILAERIYAKAEKVLLESDVHFAERYASSVAEKLPEYKALSEKLTKTDIGRIAFAGGGDRLIARYDEKRIGQMYTNERTLESDKVSEQLEQEEKNREAAANAAELERTRRGYREYSAQRKADYQAPLKRFHTIFGANPQLPASIKLHQEYNALKVENPPKELDENTITAIVLGSIIRKDRLDHQMTSSTFQGGTSTFEAFNRTFLIENIMKEKPDSARQGSFPLILVEGRRDALLAIEEYKNGRPEKAKAMVEDFVNYATSNITRVPLPSSGNMTKTSENSVPKTLPLLGAEMIGKAPFYVEKVDTEVDKIYRGAFHQSMKVVNRVYETRHEILTKPKPAGSPERAREIENLLFDQYLMSTLHRANLQKDRIAYRWTDQAPEKYGFDSEYDPTHHSEMGDNLGPLTTEQMWNHRENLVTRHEVMMSTERGIDTLRGLYLPEIRKTQLYKDLVSAEGAKYEDLLRESEAVTTEGLQSIKQIELPDVATEINKKNRARLEQRTKELDAEAEEIAIKSTRDMQEFEGYDEDSLQDNVRHLSYLTKLMDRPILLGKKLPKPAQKIIKELKGAVGAFTKYAAELAEQKKEITAADMKKYEMLAKKVQDLSEGYTAMGKAPKEGTEKSAYLAIKHVGFMARVNSELVTRPSKLAEREAGMKEAMKDVDQNRMQAYTMKHPGSKADSADFRYSVLSDAAYKTLNDTLQYNMKEALFGAKPARRQLITQSKHAIKGLTQMIKKGEDYVEAHREEALELMKDVFAERVMAKFDHHRIGTQEAERYMKRFADKIPAFGEATAKITVGTIGTFLFERGQIRCWNPLRQMI
ncbi:MAG: hypothetical protein IKN79_09925, partial [Eubacterium sp.]|nr:hypothetical protein [Eubacterium sp.]